MYTSKAQEEKKPKGPVKKFEKSQGFDIGRPFYIKSNMTFQRVVSCPAGDNVMLANWNKGDKSQTWVFDDATNTIKNSKWKTLSLTIDANGNIKCSSAATSWMQFFEYKNSKIFNIKNKQYLDIVDNNDLVDQKLIGKASELGLHQQWSIEYADEWKGLFQKGDFNKEFGLYVGRDFAVVSEDNSDLHLDIDSDKHLVMYNKSKQNT
jgi:hypothetical protein